MGGVWAGADSYRCADGLPLVGSAPPCLVRDWGRINMANQLPTQYLYNNHTKNSWSGRQVSFIRGSSRSSLPSECEAK